MSEQRSQSGFTLIETILYIALFVLIMGSVILATYNMIASTDKSQYRSLMHNEAQFAVRKFNWLLSGATTVSVPSAQSLQISNPEISSNPITIQLSGTKFTTTINGTTSDLTGEISPVYKLPSKNVFVINPITGARPLAVEMNFAVKNVYYEETFTTKKLVR